jgi:DNA-binding Lrp family transcriptional regulator
VRSVSFLAVSILVLFLGCTHKINENKPVPDDLIPKEQMVDIFVDLKIMDAILASKQRKKEQDQQLTKLYLHNSIMEKYGITRDRFERSVEYYQRDLKVLDEIYEEAITKLSKMKSEEGKNN